MDSINLSIVERRLRPWYKKWTKGDGRVGRPPTNPVGLVLSLLIELVRGWSRPDLVAFLEGHEEWVRFLGFQTTPDGSTWSKLLDRVPQAAIDQLLADLVQDLTQKGFLRPTTVAADGSFLPGCPWDPEARWGYVRRDEERFLPAGLFCLKDGKVLGYGYRVHVLVDANVGLPLAIHLTPANHNDAAEFPSVYEASLASVDWTRIRHFAGDKGYDTTGVRATIARWDTDPVIPAANTPDALPNGGFTGRRAQAYRKRTSVERFFSMLKGFFQLLRWGIVGLERVRKWVTLAALACLLVGWANHQAGRPVHSIPAFVRSLA